MNILFVGVNYTKVQGIYSGSAFALCKIRLYLLEPDKDYDVKQVSKQHSNLPEELRTLVSKVSAMLGTVIREYEGDAFFDVVEGYRQQLKATRNKHDIAALQKIFKQLAKHDRKIQFKIAHAFSLLLELINACETAYRTWRLQQKPDIAPTVTNINLRYVLTAHPTEARSIDVVELFADLSQLFIEGFYNDFNFHESKVMSYLRMLWHYPIVKYKKTTVQSEANYIYSIIFSPNINEYLLQLKDGFELQLSTWVGGDKDGHPGVDANVMINSLSDSRARILNVIQARFARLKDDLKLLKNLGQSRDKELKKVDKLQKELSKLANICKNDGARVTAWIKDYNRFVKSSNRLVAKHFTIEAISHALTLFPALVLPLELRENIDEIYAALSDRKQSICVMLETLQAVTHGADLRDYARSFIISHCGSAADISAANKLAKQAMKTQSMPIVPLFEDRQAILNANSILSEWLQVQANLNQVRRRWSNQLEVMLGYSDSAKQVGMLASRFLIRQSMFAIEKTLKTYDIKPVFFHGSGGSVERGGGSLREQILWWPNAAAENPKMTVQGEMIQRNFASSEILHSQCRLLSNEAGKRTRNKAVFIKSQALTKFVELVETAYQDLVGNTDYIQYCLDATPFHYLNVLKIGSRPSKRQIKTLSLESLRAIPWVLCWTQARILLPTWWGVGGAFKKMSAADKAELKSLYLKDPFFSSFMNALGFTLAKVELPVWGMYLRAAHGKAAVKIFKEFEDEFDLTINFVRSITGSKQLIPRRPWLEESIALRSPYVNILNMLQIIAMQNKNEVLLKETLVGIACGMLTTG